MMEKALIGLNTQILIEKCLNKPLASSAKNILRNCSYLTPKKLKSKAENNEIKLFSSLSIKELLVFYKNKSFVKSFMRKILRKKLKSYENIGYNDRQELWYQASDAKLVQEFNVKEYYETLRDRFKEIPDRFNELIELDLKRTSSTPEDLNDRENHEIKLKKCANILKTYVKRNPDIGYCQGLNYIVWELTERFEKEEEAFWVFTVILENYLPLDYYTTMKGVLIDQKIFGIMVSLLMPDLMIKFKECNLDCSLVSIQWFVCLFCKTLNHTKELIDIVFDNIIIQGSLALFKIGLALLKWLKPAINKAKDFPNLLRILEEEFIGLNDGLRFQELINEIHIDKKLLKLARYSLQTEDTIKSKPKGPILLDSMRKKIKESQKICNTELNYCLTQMEVSCLKEENRVSGYFYIFKQDMRLIHKIDDYFVNESVVKSTKKTKKMQFSKKSEPFYIGDLTKLKDSLLIVRHEHICCTELTDGILIKKNKGDSYNNYMDILQSTIKETRLLMVSLNNSPNKITNQTPSTQTPKNQTPKNSNKRNSSNIFDFEITEKKHDKSPNLKDGSLIFLRNQGVFDNIDEIIYEKYKIQLKESKSFIFNNYLLGFE